MVQLPEIHLLCDMEEMEGCGAQPHRETLRCFLYQHELMSTFMNAKRAVKNARGVILAGNEMTFWGLLTQSFINQDLFIHGSHYNRPGPPMMLKKTAQKALTASLNHLALNQRIGNWDDLQKTPIFHGNHNRFLQRFFRKSIH